MEEQTFAFGRQHPDSLRQFIGAGRKTGERRGEKQLGIGFIGERFNLPQLARQYTGGKRVTKSKKRLQQERRNDRAIVYGAQRRRVGAEIADGQFVVAIRAASASRRVVQ